MSMQREGWVVHSPYADGTWRGWEKCLESVSPESVLALDPFEALTKGPCGVLVFATLAEAQTAITGLNASDGWIPWRIEISEPRIREGR